MADETIVAATPPGARLSMLAWYPPCSASANCPVRITDTVTLSGVTGRSPLGRGFSGGAGFSPDGTRLALVANLTGPAIDPPVSVPALVNTGTGALRLVRTARLETFENAAWAQWLPGGTRLLVGAEGGTYAIEATSLSAEPFAFNPVSSTGPDRGINYSAHVNFSTTVLPQLAH